MVRYYESIRSEDGQLFKERTKLFIKTTEDDGTIGEFLSGSVVIPEENGTMFIVDEWLIEQLDKIVFKDSTLQVKEGEELIEPVKSEKEKQREELLRQLALLDADTEEQTDTPLLDYTDEPSE